MADHAAVTVGIDIGTTSVKAVAVDESGSVVARTRVRHRLTADADRLRHDAAAAWRRGPRRALRELGVQPRAVTVTGMVPSLTAVDRRGNPMYDGLLYGDAAGRKSDGGEVVGLTGDAPQFLTALAQEVPDAAGYWPAQTTAIVALGGPPVIAESAGIVLDPLVQASQWNAAVLDACRVTTEQLPRITRDQTPVADVDGVLLDAGSIDVMCESMVSGATGPDDALVICGSTLIVIARVPQGRTPSASVQAFGDGRGGFTATAASNAGALFQDWVDRTIARPRGLLTPESVPVWTPYIRGERTPWQDASRRAGALDLHLGHNAAALRRAAFEASGFVVRHMLELMDVAPRRLVAVGGGTRSDGWMQALADCVDVPVDAATEPEGAAIGAAFLARMTAGLETDSTRAQAWARPVRRITPAAEWVAPAAARYKRFRELADAAGNVRAG